MLLRNIPIDRGMHINNNAKKFYVFPSIKQPRPISQSESIQWSTPECKTFSLSWEGEVLHLCWRSFWWTMLKIQNLMIATSRYHHLLLKHYITTLILHYELTNSWQNNIFYTFLKSLFLAKIWSLGKGLSVSNFDKMLAITGIYFHIF